MDNFIDSNILVRYFVKDNSDHFEESKKFFKAIESEKKRGIISILVVLETLWVLESHYQISRSDFVPQIVKLFSLQSISILEIPKSQLFAMLALFQKSSVDFTDIYLTYLAHVSSSSVFSFDGDIGKVRKMLS